MEKLQVRRSIFDLRPAPQSKVDDLAAFVQQFGVARTLNHWPKFTSASEREHTLNLAVAQFIAVRACLRMEMP